jgi:PAS domain S-box-containing protein
LHIITASNKFLEATATTREFLKGKHIFEAFPDNPDLPDADGMKNINSSLQEVLRTKKPHYMNIQRYDVPNLQYPGKFITKYWEPSHTPVLDAAGEIDYIIQHANNITEKVLRLSELAESRKLELNALKKIELLNLELDVLRISELEHLKNERHFRRLMDLVPAKISNALTSGEVTYFNRHWLEYSGMSFENLRDYGYHQMMHPDEIESFTMGLAESAKSGIPFESEMRFKDLSGKYRWHLNIAAPVLNDEGKMIMWVGSTTDIQKLKEEEQKKNDFIGMVSHELKTPLTSIKAYLQFVVFKARETGDQITKNALEKSLIQVSKMTNMINGFMSVSRLENSKIIIEPSAFVVSQLMREIEEDFKNTTSSHPLIINNSDVEKLIIADKNRVEQVLKNLIGNAVKYSPRGAEIECTYFYTENEITFLVKDSGDGIAIEDQGKIFERYYRIENKISKTTAGFGIGLYFCSEVINRHKGRIWVESNLGNGSTFCFTIPINLTLV